MKTKFKHIPLVFAQLIAALTLAMTAHTADAPPETALLVVAHGSREPAWSERIIQQVEKLNFSGPKGVAFLNGKPPGHSLSNVAFILDQTGAKEIVVVPLFVSSFSGHYEEIRYFTGLRKDLPHSEHGSHDHAAEPQIKTKARLRLTPAFDGHPVASRILADQAKALVQKPEQESLVLVAHGPNQDDENARWLEHLQSHCRRLKEQLGLRRAEAVTLRDDAPDEVRDAATAQFQAMVRDAGKDSRVLILPVLISVGHVQQEIRKRLEGLSYSMADGGLASHPLVGEWILEQANRSPEKLLSQQTHAAK